MYKTTFLTMEWALPISLSSKGRLGYRISIGQRFSGSANKESSLDVDKHQPINPFGSFFDSIIFLLSCKYFIAPLIFFLLLLFK